MRAAVVDGYGPPSKIRIKNVPKPIPKPNEILVRVYSTTINRTDCGIITAEFFLMRFFTGLFKPNPILGTDFAGKIISVGGKVKNFKKGDRVFGLNDNGLASHAEYLTITSDGPLEKMPNVSYDFAVASLEGVHYAYNFVNKVNLKKGQKVLVNGATGAIGSAAIQLLNEKGLNVHAVCGTKNVKKIKSYGVEKVIDYQKEDFTNSKEKYDFIFDAVGKSTFGKCKPLLKEKGIYISSELGPNGENVLFAIFTHFFGDKKVIFPIPMDCKKTVLMIKKLIEKKKFKPLIDKKYTFEEIIDAYEYVRKGKKVGNVILNI
jgi:NADPH:quinone reductase-like Zn-dependent oxidoreductase